MELRLLRYFLAVARENSFTRAAKYLHITQPTLSRQLMDLEEELGQKLLNRETHYITLTPEGNFSSENAAALLQNDRAQSALLAEILQTMAKKGYYGLDVDFEYVPPELREDYAAFVCRLREALNAEGKPVVAALAPKTSAQQRGLLYEAHDYALLSKAANAVFLMTYEWGYVYGEPQAIAPLPQVRAMYNGDRARKESLVEYGFRLPCAFDNRPLKCDEFEQRVHQRIYVSATPGDYEKDRAGQIVEQVIRPTGLLDPKVEVRPVENQIDDLVGEINARAARNERVLVTTLTKKMAEDLTQYLTGVGIRVRYMHADVETIERMELIRGLRLGEFDVLVGINLLREGLDIPEVSMVAILDADKEGFLRSETSLIQTIGRAARNADGLVVLYADTITPSMRRAMDETERRRQIQDDYNKAHGIIPQTIRKDVREIIEISKKDEESARRRGKRKLSERERDEEIRKLEKQMQEASRMLEFEYAAILRDRIIELRKENTK